MTKEDERCPYCKGKNKTTIIKDVSCDIYEGGEEINHIEKCNCGAYRFIIDDYNSDEEGKYDNRYYGNWQKDRRCPK